MPRVIKLREIAVARGGDKGGDDHMPVLVLRRDLYPEVRDQLTAEVVATILGNEVPGGVLRYELPNICGLNFVLVDALDGGRTRMLKFDPRWAYAERILDFEIEVPD
ncbi:MAG: hypothetical protein WEB00_01405 [Dehalococcoidia bacterium]